jgi:hypothetical protein
MRSETLTVQCSHSVVHALHGGKGKLFVDELFGDFCVREISLPQLHRGTKVQPRGHHLVLSFILFSHSLKVQLPPIYLAAFLPPA